MTTLDTPESAKDIIEAIFRYYFDENNKRKEGVEIAPADMDIMKELGKNDKVYDLKEEGDWDEEIIDKYEKIYSSVLIEWFAIQQKARLVEILKSETSSRVAKTLAERELHNMNLNNLGWGSGTHVDRF